jgi:hypothetical protein
MTLHSHRSLAASDVGVADVVAKNGHVAARGTGERRVVLERKLNRPCVQVNARIM